MNNFNIYQVVDTKTKIATILPADFLVTYGLTQPGSAIETNRVLSFHQLAVQDPFPDDYFSITGSMNDGELLISRDLFDCPDCLVYAKSRYKADTSPHIVFIPRKEVMLKMMRACVLVEEQRDLWIFKNENAF